jgi:hypothetical protein
MDKSLFSGFNIASEMADIQKSPQLSKSAVNSPALKAKMAKLDGLETLDGFVEPVLSQIPPVLPYFPLRNLNCFRNIRSI